MPLDVYSDFPTENVGNQATPALDPIDTISDSDVHRIMSNSPAVLRDIDVDRIMGGNININVPGPAPSTRAGLAAEAERLRFEREYQPAEALTPLGTNPRINYGEGESSAGNPLSNTAAQIGLGLLQGGASLGKKITGLGSFITQSEPTQAEEYSNVERGLESVGHETGGLPLVRNLTSGIVSTAPEQLTGAIGGLPAIAISFGLGAAGSAYTDAKQAGYEHPDAYALLSGLISAGTALIPGYKGPNMVANAEAMVNNATWRQYAQKLLTDYGSGKFWETHGGATALMMGVQSALQNLLNKKTISPDLTWGDIVTEAAQSAGMGAIIGEGFGALGKAAYHSQRQNALTDILKDYIKGVERSSIVDLRGSEVQPGHEQRIQPAQSEPVTQPAPQKSSLRLPVEPASQPAPPPVIPEEESVAAVKARNNPSPVMRDIGEKEYKQAVAAMEAKQAREGLGEPIPTPAPKPLTFEQRLNQATNEQDVRGILKEVRHAYGREILTEEDYIDLARQAADKLDAINPVVATPKEAAPISAPPVEATAPAAPDPRFLNGVKGTGAVAPTPEHLAVAQRTGFKAEPSSSAPGVEPTWGFQDSKGLSFYVPVGSSEADVLKAYQAKLPPVEKPKTVGSLRVKQPKPVVAPPVAAVPEATTEPSGIKLPKKGEQLPIGDFFITRDKLGRIVLRAPGADKALAYLRFKPEEPRNKQKLVEALTPKGVLDDLIAEQRGEKTKYWTLAKGRAGLGNVRAQVKGGVAESVQAGIEAVVADVQKALGEAHPISQALQSGALGHEMLTKLVGEKVLTKGGKAVAKELKKQVDEGVTKYLAMASKSVEDINSDFDKGLREKYLLERHEVGKRGTVPPELLGTKPEKLPDGTVAETQTGKVQSLKEIEATYGKDKEKIEGRVLQLLVGNKAVDIAAGEQPAPEPKAGEQEEMYKDTAELPATATAPVDQTGLVKEEVVTQFEDSDLNTPEKKKAAETANEIKQEVLGGDAARYDEGMQILEKSFGFTKQKAEQWMDSESLFLTHFRGRKTYSQYRFELTNALENAQRRDETLKSMVAEAYPNQPIDNFSKDLIDLHMRGVSGEYTPEMERVAGYVLNVYPELSRIADRATNTQLEELNAPAYNGKLRPARATDFSNLKVFQHFQEAGFLKGNPLEALQRIAGSKHPFATLAERLIRLYGSEIAEIKLGNVGGNSNSPGSYDTDTHSIKINSKFWEHKFDSAELDTALLHEVVHGLTVRKLYSLGPRSEEWQALQQISEEIEKGLPSHIQEMLQDLKKGYSEGRAEFEIAAHKWSTHPEFNKYFQILYGLLDPHEFVAQAFTSEEFRNYVSSQPKSLWQRIKDWVTQLLFKQEPGKLGDISKVIDSIMQRPGMTNTEWLEQWSRSTTFNYPEIRTPKQYAEAADYRREETPEEEKVVLTRKALANNNWLLAPDIQAVLKTIPDRAQGLIKSIVGNRLAVIEATKDQPGANEPSTLQELLDDPSLPIDRKSEVVLSTLHNVLWFKHQAGLLTARTMSKIKSFTADLDRMDKGINEQTASVVALDDAIERMVDEFKDKVLTDKREALTEEQSESLTRMLVLANELKGDRKTALSRFMSSLAQRIDLDTLLSIENPKDLQRIIEHQFPLTPETAQSTGASEETIKMASILMANSNELREELLTLKLTRDEKFMQSVLNINEIFNDEVKKGNITTVIKQFSTKLGKITTRREREHAVYRQLFAGKINRLKTIDKLSNASEGLKEVLATKSFKDLDELVTERSGLTKPMKMLLATGQVQYTHPITREPVNIGMSFEKDAETENYLKLYDLAESAMAYLANPSREHYSPAEAAFWRNFLKNSAFLLDPTVSFNARKIVPLAADPHKLTGFLGGLAMIPDQVARRIGGRAAIDFITGLQSLSVVDSQLGNLKKKWDAPLSRTANAAAKVHGMPIEQWHNEVLNPLIASRQTTGYEPLHAGSRTIFGHVIHKEDEAAFQTQRDFDREIVKIALTGKGNPAVLAEPARITFKGPGGQYYQRPIQSTGSDTMSRRLNYDSKVWATDWFNNTSVEARKVLMDTHFAPIVLGHTATAGAPDYSIKSGLTSLYNKVLQSHADNPIETTDDLVHRLFESQHEFMEPQNEMTREEIQKTLMDEISTIFKNTADYDAGKPTPDVGALLSVVDTDNSFTQARGHLIAPTTFYNYGLTFDYNRIARLHSAKAFYTMNLAAPNGLLDRLIAAVDTQANQYKSQLEKEKKSGVPELKAISSLKNTTKEKQLSGDTLLTYEQALDASKKLQILKRELTRLLSNTSSANDPDARQLAASAQSFVVANVLAGVQSQNTNAFGGLGNIMLVDKMLLGRSATASGIGLALRTLIQGSVDVAANLSKLVDPGSKWLVQTLRNPAFTPVANWVADVLDARIKLHKDMEVYGLAPAANVRQDLNALFEMRGSAGRPQAANPTAVQKLMRGTETALSTVAIPLSAVAPRLMDRFINELTVWKAQDIENMLRLNAVKFGAIKEGLNQPAGSSWIANELFGKKANTKQELLLRTLFERNHQSLDSLMWKYYEAQKANKRAEFFTPEERAAFQYSLAQDINLPTFANRLLSGKGSKGRNFLGIFFGYPAWYAGKLSDYLAKTSLDKTGFKYMPSVVTASIALALLGAMGINNTKRLKDFFYNEKTDYPDLFQSKTPSDAATALTVGLFTYVPVLGNIVNNYILNRPVRNGFDLNSQFLMLNLFNDIFNTGRQILQEHSATRPVEDFLRRWSPLARIVINRLPGQEGITEYFNISRELKTLAPTGMETRKRGKTQVDATPVTPMLQDMTNAAYRNDAQGFMNAVAEYVKYKVGQGVDPEQAMTELKSSWRSRHPLIREFGRTPTEAEMAAIYEKATPEQRQELNHANEVFDTFGSLLGTRVDLAGGTGPRSGGGSGGGLSGGVGGAGLATPRLIGSLRAGGGGSAISINHSPSTSSRQPFKGPVTAGGSSGGSAGSGAGSLRIRKSAGSKRKGKVLANVKRPSLRIVASASRPSSSLKIRPKHGRRSSLA